MANGKRFRFSTALEVRWRDADPMGHVNNAVYFTYFEVGRMAYLHAIGEGSKGVPAEDFRFILVSAACDYHAPVRYGRKVTVALRVSRLGTKSFDVEYRITSGRKVVATGRTVQVAYDYARGVAVPVSSSFRRRVARYEGSALKT